MSDKNLETVSNSDSDNWHVLESIFLETTSSASPASRPLDNWDVLQSLFGLAGGRMLEPTNGNPSKPIKPETPTTESTPDVDTCPPDSLNFCIQQTTIEAAECAKQTAEVASDKAYTAQQTAETAKTKAQSAQQAIEISKTQAEAAKLGAQQAHQAIEVIKTKAQADYHTIQTAKTQAEATKLSAQQTQQAAGTVNAELQATYSTIENTKAAIKTAETEAETAKVNTQRVYRATEEARMQAEAASQRAQQAQKAAETARERVEQAQQQVEVILRNISSPSVPPASSTNTRLLTDFLQKHRMKLLLGSIALIPLLLLLTKALSPKPILSANPPITDNDPNAPSDGRVTPLSPSSQSPISSIYVNPITGNDTNDGTVMAPFRTLPHAVQQARAGSTIYLDRGNYSTERSLAIPDNTKLVIQPFSFNDVEGHWAAPFIRALAAQGLIAGYPNGSFRPDANLTRAEYATLLTKVFDLPETQAVNRFRDVRSEFWAYLPIQATYSRNFLKGFPNGDFKPNDNVQRVQVIAALVSGLNLASTNSGNPLSLYQDRSLIPSWASAQVATATTKQLIVNYPDLQTLNPTQSATRAETIVMMHQALVEQGKMPAIESPYLVTP